MGLVETSLEVLKLAAKAANPELLIAATKANVEALQLSAKNLELHKEVEELRGQMRVLEEKLKLTGEVYRHRDFVFREGEDGSFCSRCWDVDRKLVHIIELYKKDGAGRGPGCPECKTFTWGRGINPRSNANQPVKG